MTDIQYKIGDFFTPDCPHADGCISKGSKCKSCKHNKQEEDHYAPKNPWTYPDRTPAPYIWPSDKTPYKHFPCREIWCIN